MPRAIMMRVKRLNSVTEEPSMLLAQVDTKPQLIFTLSTNEQKRTDVSSPSLPTAPQYLRDCADLHQGALFAHPHQRPMETLVSASGD
jgi:hypothetical protein